MIPARFSKLSAAALSNPVARDLVEQGYSIVRQAMPREQVAAMSQSLDHRFANTPFSIGPFHGERTKRFHRLLSRCPGSDELVMQNGIMGAVRSLLGLWCDFPELNLTQGAEIHPGAPAQIPHCDHNMWPNPKGEMECSVNVFWPMCDFTVANGATRVWPGSHRAVRDPSVPLPKPLVCEMEPGDALVTLGSTVHAAGANMSECPRRAAIVSYCLGWLKAYENQNLAYSADFARTLHPELAAMIGYRWHRPNLGTYDGQCPSILLSDQVPDHLATVDALSPEHEQIVAEYRYKLLGLPVPSEKGSGRALETEVPAAGVDHMASRNVANRLARSTTQAVAAESVNRRSMFAAPQRQSR